MPRHARPSLLLALLLLSLTLPVARAADTGTLSFVDGAPVLGGIAHPATSTEPWSGVALSWTATPGAISYTVWRKGPLDIDFGRLDPAAGLTTLVFADTAVQPSTTYSYFVVPTTLLQVYLPSNTVTVTAPPPPDITAPVPTITSPVAGTRVFGIVRVTASAADNVAVTAIELRSAAGVLLKRVAGASLAYDWNTKGLKKGSAQTLVVRAFDGAGNVGAASVTVTIK